MNLNEEPEVYRGSKFMGGPMLDARFRLCTRDCTAVPAGNGLLMPLPLEQFLTALLLGIFSVQNLEPRRFLTVTYVGSSCVLGYNPFQIQFTNALK